MSVVYIVFECQGGHETEVDCVLSSEAGARKYIEDQDNPSMWHYEEFVIGQC